MFLVFFSYYFKERMGLVNVYMNDDFIFRWRITAMDYDSKNYSNLQYIGFASPKDGVTEKIFYEYF